MSLKLLCPSVILLWVLGFGMMMEPFIAEAQGPSYPYSVALSWTASTTTGVTGYNIYRGLYSAGVCGAYTKLTATPLSATTTTDSDTTVAPGITYCYGATSLVGTAESGLDTTTNVAIPPAPPTGLAATVN